MHFDSKIVESIPYSWFWKFLTQEKKNTKNKPALDVLKWIKNFKISFSSPIIPKKKFSQLESVGGKEKKRKTLATP